MLDAETRGLIRLEAQKKAREAMSRGAERPTASGDSSQPYIEVTVLPIAPKEPPRRGFLQPGGPQTLNRAQDCLNQLAKCVPKRIDTEEIGDALERVYGLVAEGRPSWIIYATVARVCSAVLMHTLRHGAEQLVGVLMKFTAGPGDDRQ
jgi:hypothetical protein